MLAALPVPLIIALGFSAWNLIATRDWEVPQPGGLRFILLWLAGVAAVLAVIRWRTGRVGWLHLLAAGVVIGSLLTDITQFPSLPARTVMHGSGGGRRWFKMYGRGDDFYDWDANAFHFIGSVGMDQSENLTYRAHSMDWHSERVALDANGKPIV